MYPLDFPLYSGQEGYAQYVKAFHRLKQILPYLALGCRAETPGLWLGGILHLTNKRHRERQQEFKRQTLFASCSFPFPRISIALSFWEQSFSKTWPSWRQPLSFHQKCLPSDFWVLSRKVASLSSEDRTEWPCPVLLPCIEPPTLHPGPFAPQLPWEQ